MATKKKPESVIEQPEITTLGIGVTLAMLVVTVCILSIFIFRHKSEGYVGETFSINRISDEEYLPSHQYNRIVTVANDIVVKKTQEQVNYENGVYENRYRYHVIISGALLDDMYARDVLFYNLSGNKLQITYKQGNTLYFEKVGQDWQTECNSKNCPGDCAKPTPTATATVGPTTTPHVVKEYKPTETCWLPRNGVALILGHVDNFFDLLEVQRVDEGFDRDPEICPAGTRFVYERDSIEKIMAEVRQDKISADALRNKALVAQFIREATATAVAEVAQKAAKMFPTPVK